jgi:hypothetical protein
MKRKYLTPQFEIGEISQIEGNTFRPNLSGRYVRVKNATMVSGNLFIYDVILLESGNIISNIVENSDAAVSVGNPLALRLKKVDLATQKAVEVVEG